MENSSLSVIMPNYNHGHYIAEALQSVVSQSLLPKEVIVVDDASTDNSVNIIEEFQSRYPFVKLLRNEMNQGAIYSLNRALSESSGDYIRVMSADDRAGPGLFEKSMALLTAHPQAGLCTALVSYIDESGRDLGPCPSPIISNTSRYLTPKETLQAFLREGDWLQTFTLIFRRSNMVEVGGYDPELGHASDGYLAYAIALKYGVCFIPERLAFWRKLEGSFALKSVNDPEAFIDLVSHFEKRMKGEPLFSEIFIEKWKQRTFRNMIYETNRLHPERHDLLVFYARQIPTPSWGDRIFVKAMERNLDFGGLTSKLYLFANQSWPDRWRIAANKIWKATQN